jgi:hypothetical protein
VADPLTFNTKQVAAKMGVSRWTVQMWKRLGLRFDYGTRTTPAPSSVLSSTDGNAGLL